MFCVSVCALDIELFSFRLLFCCSRLLLVTVFKFLVLFVWRLIVGACLVL